MPRRAARGREAVQDEPARRYARPAQEEQQQPARSELAQSIDNLVAADARSWVFNSFDRGSVYDTEVESRDAQGRATSIHANYSYNSGRNGWVRIRIAGGKFSCMEFWDFAGNCRALGHSPSQGVAAAAIATAAVAVVVAASSSSSGHSSGGYSGSNGGYNPPQRQDNPPQQQPEPEPRTYGLYGNCPQPGAGYGC